MDKLYHSTLARNVPSIRKLGLLPQRGLWTADYHSKAEALVYATNESHRGKLATIMAGQLAKAGFVQWSEKYQFDHFKNDLFEHCAIIILKVDKLHCYPDRFEAGHPDGTEPGDWYSRQVISVEEILGVLTGQELLDWLEPSEPDFTYRLRDVLRRRCGSQL
jgi:hypothetical protein